MCAETIAAGLATGQTGISNCTIRGEGAGAITFWCEQEPGA